MKKQNHASSKCNEEKGLDKKVPSILLFVIALQYLLSIIGFKQFRHGNTALTVFSWTWAAGQLS
ncbi:MAG TPA: hypothetical protein VE263_09310 [Candidatus Angelobacter sp.]|nr:hypothetical protein [Candidatus Angelobacter sp.]